MAEHKHKKQVLDRLARVAGHVEGIRKMVAEDRDCAEVLIQISATRAALGSAAKILLSDHLEGCIADAVRDGRADLSLKQLQAAVDRML